MKKKRVAWNKGKSPNVETKLKMSLSHKGKKPSLETRKKLSASRLGAKNPRWKNGRKKLGNGYVTILSPNHPHNYKGYVLEHRLVMEAHLGRTLLLTEVVHHINGIVDDNRIENLQLFSSNGEHLSFHFTGRRLKNGI